MKVYDAIASVIAQQGIDTVFGLMGDGNLKLIPRLTHSHGIRFYQARHEAAAVTMADGYARTTGTIGVATVTQGPGLTNTLTAMTAAQHARTPMVILAGALPESDRANPQFTDQEPVFAAAGVATHPLRSAETVWEDIAAAFERARAEQRPIGMNLWNDIQDMEAPEPPSTSPPAGSGRPSVVAEPPEAAIRRAADLLAGAQRPLILAGRGAVRARCRAELEAIAERTGALLATSLQAKDLFSGNPFSVGVSGGFASDLAGDLIADADVVVVFGASLNRFTSSAGRFYGAGTTVVQCDVDPRIIGANASPDVGIVADAGTTARALLAELEDRGHRAEGYRTAAVTATLEGHRPADEFTDQSRDGALDARTVCIELDQILPMERNLVVDGGHHCGFPSTYISVPEPASYVFCLDFGSIGLGLGTALGMAIGRPDRLTVGVVGDGGLMMSLGDLDIAVRYKIPLVVVVMNDEAYGAEYHYLRTLKLPVDDSLFANPSFAAVAEAMGAEGMTVNRLEDLREVGRRTSQLSGPLVVDCRLNIDVRAAWLDKLYPKEAIAEEAIGG